MKLRELIAGMAISNVDQDVGDVDIVAVVADSRKVTDGSLFVALPGPRTHGEKFVADAVKRGARVIVTETGMRDLVPGDIVHLIVADPQVFLVQALRSFFYDPSSRINLIGITGTNGKTTITYLLEIMLAARGICGVIGTINHRYGGMVFKAENTTPGVVENFELLAQMALHHVSYCAMEVSSHALDQRRVAGLDFRYAIFTNLTSDHLDYHANRENYFLAKAKLFTGLMLKSRGIINLDDEFGLRLKEMTTVPVWTYGIKNAADFSARKIVLGFTGSYFELVTPHGVVEIKTALIGCHNIYNILAVAAVGIGEGMSLDLIKKGIESLPQVPGRLERIEAGQNFHVFIDYAHTEDALKNVLSSIRAVKKTRVIVVFGCGGDRDKTKRPKMAGVVEELSDFSIVTTDNPRTEDPQEIIREICAGFKKNNYRVILDRSQAIAAALALAQKDEVVLIAGKGHEDYQIFKDQKIAFDEHKIVREFLRTSGK